MGAEHRFWAHVPAKHLDQFRSTASSGETLSKPQRGRGTRGLGELSDRISTPGRRRSCRACEEYPQPHRSCAADSVSQTSTVSMKTALRLKGRISSETDWWGQQFD